MSQVPVTRSTDNSELHPSYGLVGLSRVQGRAILVGSEIEHHDFILLTVKRAEKKRDLSREWWFGYEELLRLWLSPVQFATMLTTMNVGDGVPCTLRHADHAVMPMPPKPDTQHSLIHNEFKQTCKDAANKLKAALALATSGPRNKAEQVALVDAIKMAMQELESNLPFVEKSFTEATEHTVNDAKAEIEACIVGAIQRTGLEHLRQMQLGAGGEDGSELLPTKNES